MRESRIVITWLPLPPEELIATRAPRRINRRHTPGMQISVADTTSTPLLDGMCRVGGTAPRSGLRASTGSRRAPPPASSADDGAGFPVSGGTSGGVWAMENLYADNWRSCRREYRL